MAISYQALPQESSRQWKAIGRLIDNTVFLIFDNNYYFDNRSCPTEADCQTLKCIDWAAGITAAADQQQQDSSHYLTMSTKRSKVNLIPKRNNFIDFLITSSGLDEKVQINSCFYSVHRSVCTQQHPTFGDVVLVRLCVCVSIETSEGFSSFMTLWIITLPSTGSAMLRRWDMSPLHIPFLALIMNKNEHVSIQSQHSKMDDSRFIMACCLFIFVVSLRCWFFSFVKRPISWKMSCIDRCRLAKPWTVQPIYIIFVIVTFHVARWAIFRVHSTRAFLELWKFHRGNINVLGASFPEIKSTMTVFFCSINAIENGITEKPNASIDQQPEPLEPRQSRKCERDNTNNLIRFASRRAKKERFHLKNNKLFSVLILIN